jgi:RNA polymerase sigma factor for flagellar operon FliA
MAKLPPLSPTSTRSTPRMGRRDALVQEHLGLVRDTVARVGGALPDEVDAGDLAGHGIAALIEAAGEYAGATGGFGAFAKGRVWRRVTGFVREQAWYREAWEMATSPPIPSPLHGEGGKATSPPTPSPLQGEGGKATAHYEAVCAAMAVEAREFLEADEDRGRDGDATRLYARATRDSPATRLGKRIAALPELERTVLGLWFQEELSLQEIGEVLEMGLTEVKAAFARGGLAAR